MDLGLRYIFLASLFVGVQMACADDGAQTAINPATDLSLEQLKVTRERPLFTPNRRAPAAPAAIVAIAPPPPPPAPPPHVSLLGVLVDATGPRAVIQADGQNKNIAVRLGDYIQGWRVTHIEMQQLVISLDDRDLAVNLFGTEHGTVPVPVVHRPDRVFEISSSGRRLNHDN